MQYSRQLMVVQFARLNMVVLVIVSVGIHLREVYAEWYLGVVSELFTIDLVVIYQSSASVSGTVSGTLQQHCKQAVYQTTKQQ